MIRAVILMSLVFCSQLEGDQQYEYTPPTQPPIRPPYQQACHLRRNNLLFREDTPSNPGGDETELPAESTWRTLWDIYHLKTMFKEERVTLFQFCQVNKYFKCLKCFKISKMLMNHACTSQTIFLVIKMFYQALFLLWNKRNPMFSTNI